MSFISDQSKRVKIKDEKIIQWRTELSCSNIQYRNRKDNVAVDCLSRDISSCSALNSSKNTVKLHKTIKQCHPVDTCIA